MRQWRDRYYRWMYRGGHPNWWARPQNRLSAIIGRLVPSRMVELEVAGRSTGRRHSLPLAVADYQGERYLVAMLGQSTNWVRNVRAAGGRAVLRRGLRREPVRLQEVDAGARAPILRRYLSNADPGPRSRSIACSWLRRDRVRSGRSCSEAHRGRGRVRCRAR
jgi:hypothetical protein